jgi:hypothetical protein
VIPLRLNSHQRRIREAKREAILRGKPSRFLLTKFRQFGGTTLEVAEDDYLTGTFRGQYAVTIAHDLETTIHIFGIANRMYENLSTPELCEPGTKNPLFHWRREQQNRRELKYLEADSVYFIGTAGNENFGHGLTINKAHLSEAARFPNLEGSLAALEGVPAHGEVTLESTPKGAVGKYYDLNQEAFNDPTFEWTLIFFRWFEFPEYALETTEEESAQILAEVANGSHDRFGNEEQALAQRLAAQEDVVLTAGQWKWRRWKRGTLKDIFFEQYPEDFVSCWLASGRSFFDLLDLQKCPDGKVISRDEGGCLWTYEDSVAGRDYVIWADPAEGIERGREDQAADGSSVESANKGSTDYTAWGIIDRETLEDCAIFLGRVTPSELARMIDTHGRRYNDALASIERNNHGHAVLLKLEEVCAYPNIYHHLDRLNEAGEEERRPGFPTTVSTRSTILDELDDDIRQGLYRPRDPRMKAQMQAFIVNPKGKAESGKGAHDDLVLGRAHGGYVCKRSERSHTLSMLG